MRIHVTENFDQIARQLAVMGANVFERAAASAMNKTIAKAKTAMKREIRAEFNIPASTVEKSLRIRRAYFRSGTVKLEAALESPTQNGRAMNVIHFGARQTKKGVSVRIRKAGGRSVISHAFIANGGRTVFARVGKSRLPIKPVRTIAVAQMFNARRVRGKVEQMVRAEFPVEFKRAAEYFSARH